MKIVVTLSSHVYQLSALRSALAAAAMLVVAYARTRGADKSGRKCLAQVRLCAQLTRQLIARSVHNHRVERKQAMQASPSRRAQVLKDLGGEAGLLRWEARLVRAEKRARDRDIFEAARAAHKRQGTFYQATLEGQSAPHLSPLLNRESAGAKTIIYRYPNMFFDPCKLDRSGVFRLAPIRRGPSHSLAARGRQAAKTGPLRRDGKVRYLSGLRAPIPLLPRDLRVRARGDGSDWGRPLALAAGGGGFAASDPPIGKPP